MSCVLHLTYLSLLVCPLCLPQLETMMNQVNTLQGRLNMVEKEKVSTCTCFTITLLVN